MRLTREQLNARARERYAARKAEANDLYRRREQRELEERRRVERDPDVLAAAQHRADVLERVHDKLRSPEFRAWYEATTGEDVAEFLAEVIVSPEEYAQRPRTKMRLTQLDWTQSRVELLALQNPWSDPEQRRLWAAELQEDITPQLRRRILLRLGSPRWADREKMIAIYMERQRLVNQTGLPHDVDHIVPIVSHVVCGLHCEFNLRVITATANRRKSNKFACG